MPDFFSNSSEKGIYKTNIMRSINWVIVVIESLLGGGFLFGTEPWIRISSFIASIVFAIIYLGIFLYIYHDDPDRLQSEHYNIIKMQTLTQKSDQSLSITQEQVQIQSNQLNKK